MLNNFGSLNLTRGFKYTEQYIFLNLPDVANRCKQVTENGVSFVSQMTEKMSVVVSGCSRGIGYCVVEVLLAEGFHVFGSVRKEADAIRLQKDFGESFTPLMFDVTDEVAVQKCAVQVRLPAISIVPATERSL
jgi:phosphoenolpyruvate synthase/pyruvate phosphate dikinase